VNPIDVFTKQAMEGMGNAASAEHYRRLEEGQLCATRCDDCAAYTFPPQSHCPRCFGDQVTWTEIGEGAVLYAFTTQGRALRFRAPAVIGIVQIPEVGLVLAPIGAKLDELEIGQAMRPEVIEIDDGARKVHRFVPA
jgi:uncharacterized OB-fold protein